jgi:hypothetical protein
MGVSSGRRGLRAPGQRHARDPDGGELGHGALDGDDPLAGCGPDDGFEEGPPRLLLPVHSVHGRSGAAL